MMPGSPSKLVAVLNAGRSRFSWERSLLLLIVVYLGGRELLPAFPGFAQEEPPGVGVSAVVAPSTAFTYQGRVEVDGLPANGSHDLTFNLWDAATAGNIIGTSPAPGTIITNGLFSASVDFDQAYTEGKRTWIETVIDPPGTPPPVSLGRLELTVPPHDHLYQDWLGSSDGTSLSIRNLGEGDAVSLEASSGSALAAISAGNDPVIDISVQGNGYGLLVNGGTQEAIRAISPSISSTIRGDNTYSACSPFGGCFGVAGHSTLGSGVAGFGTIGVLGDGDWGVYGVSDVAGKAGVRGDSTLLGGCSKLFIDTLCYGVRGDASLASGNGGVGVSGTGTFAGILGIASGTDSYAGLFLGSIGARSIVPLETETYILGDLTHRWLDIYTKNPINVSSDRRMKKDILETTYGLEEVMRLRPVSFHWNEGTDDSTHLGLIAQEVREVIPEAVHGDEAAGSLSMTPDTLLPVLIKAIQEQQAEIETLRAVAIPSSTTTGQIPSPAVLAAVAAGILGLLLFGATLGVRLRRS